VRDEGFEHLRDQLVWYMEKKEMVVKTEDAVGSSSFPCYNSNVYPFSNAFDFSEVEKSSLGFMELLGVQDYSPLLELPQLSTVSAPHHSTVKAPSDNGKECSEVLNHQPATPNSSSISSASSDAVNDEQNKTLDQVEEDDDEEEEGQHKTKKQWVFSIYLITFSFLGDCWIFFFSSGKITDIYTWWIVFNSVEESIQYFFIGIFSAKTTLV